MVTKLQVEGLVQAYPSSEGERPVLDGVDLSVGEGEFVSLIGPSGCGKSTLFNAVSGLEYPKEGRILLDGQEITGEVGHVGYMMQRDALFPWRTVLENAILAAEVDRRSRREALARARELLPAFGLEGFGEEYPARLSGGMRQRAALLRTVMSEREVWLLDEPLGALDALTRERMQDWLLSIRERFPRTILFITHSIDEAVYLSDRILVLSPRPAQVRGEVEIPLPRKRFRTLEREETFLHCKEEVRQWL
ncbi:ABC transporter ATP-binding protein [Salinithrix halophila]|uniref:ABC transporter ATP-binding protein n=1 Tax=Salinithrix halophila TaxID=1485204 RepID=A0ABV8JEF8_9BACL